MAITTFQISFLFFFISENFLFCVVIEFRTTQVLYSLYLQNAFGYANVRSIDVYWNIKFIWIDICCEFLFRETWKL